MKIVSLELIGYKRLKLNNINRIKLSPISNIQFILGTNGAGKAQPLSSSIKTPGGWDTMGNMTVNKKIIAKDGTISKVTGVFPQGKQHIYKVTFDDGRTTRATGDHLWKVYIGGKERPLVPQVMTTLEVIEVLNKKTYSNLIYIDLIDSEESPDVALDIDPYTLGTILRDRHLKSHERFIPEAYLHGSTKQRLELLQGLMDTDGTIYANGSSSYSSSSLQLAEDVQYLVRSLGGKASMSYRKQGRTIYQINIRYKRPSDLFTLPKKKARTNDNDQGASTLKLRVLTIESDGYEEAQCISIDHPDKLYITNAFVVTHNSSLLKELSPLPAIHNEFDNTGYKQIVLTKNNATYTLTSDFTAKANIYSFIKDDLELNTGNTITVFKDLVYKEFNITQDIHNLMLGLTCFHLMSIADRRKWFTTIAEVDYTYAIKYYNKIKEKHRDVSGAIKLAKARLVQESDKLLDEDEEAKARLEIKELNNLLDTLLSLRTQSNKDSSAIKSQLSTLESRLDVLSKDVLNKSTIYTNLKDFSSLDELRLSSMSIIYELDILEKSKTTIWNEIQSNTNTLEAVDKSNVGTIEELDSKIDRLSKELADNKTSMKLQLDMPDPINLKSSIEHIYQNITDIVVNIQPDPHKANNRQKYEQLIDHKKSLTHRIANLDNDQHVATKYKLELEHRKKHNELNCPECKYKWYPGYDDKKYKELTASIERRANEIVLANKKLEEVESELETLTSYIKLLHGYRDLTKNWPVLNVLWDYISEREYIFKSPDSILGVLHDFKYDLDTAIINIKIANELKDAIGVKKLINNDIELDKGKLQAAIKEGEEKLLAIGNDISRKNTRLERLKFYISTITELDDSVVELETIMNEQQTLSHELIELHRQQALNSTIRAVKMRASDLEQLVTTIDVRKGVIDNITENISQLEVDNKILKDIIKALSPTEGLIAKGLSGFINSFVKQVNGFIKKIWLYPLELKPVELNADDNVELDFKFTVVINDNIHVKDVKELSSAMKEVVDLAFRVVSMKYLGLEEAPLFLDEFSVKMDHAHRQSAFYAITNLINTAEFSQIYMISHYENSYGSFKNADITVLSASNIVLPKNISFNQNVEIS